MRETLDGFKRGLQIGGRMITNLRYADDSILLATSEPELQELVERLDRVSRKDSLLINIDNTKVMASDGIACRILIQNELLEQVDTFPDLGSLITEDGECTTEFRTRLNRGQAIGASLRKIWKSHSIPLKSVCGDFSIFFAVMPQSPALCLTWCGIPSYTHHLL